MAGRSNCMWALEDDSCICPFGDCDVCPHEDEDQARLQCEDFEEDNGG